jgi:hypothetical protein
VSSRTTLYLTAALSAGLLLIGLTILITGVLTDRRVGLVIQTGTTTTAIGVIATVVNGYRALNEYITSRVAHADSAALVKAIVQHDAQFTAPSTVVEFDAARRQRENAT